MNITKKDLSFITITEILLIIKNKSRLYKNSWGLDTL